MGIKKYIESIQRGLRRPEVRLHPVQAISKRLQWRWHWRQSPNTPVLLEKWHQSVRIALPQTGNAALVFYRRHSDPNMVWLLQTLLYPGMTFLDVGAHIGEFTLVGAHMIGASGKAIAIEPLPPCIDALRHNASINNMSQITVYNGALCDYTGKIGFQSDPQRSAGWIAAQPREVAFEVQCWTLDDFLPFAGIERADVIKLDAGGNELSVLRGAGKAISEDKVGVLLMKLYHPNVTRERFNYASNESVAFLREKGFQLKLVAQENAFPIVQPEDINAHFDSLTYCHLLVATKC